MILQAIVSFLAVFCFSIVLELPKKFLILAGLTGTIGWIIFLIGTDILELNIVISSLISSVFIAITSMFLSKIFKVIITVFFVPGILPIVPGVSLYKMVYNALLNNMEMVKYYFFETILIAGSIALSIFLIDSFNNIKITDKKCTK